MCEHAGDTGSVGLKGMKEGFYHKHSAVQASVVDKALPHISNAARTISLPTDRPLQVAEFGCNHGINSIKPVRAVLEVLQERVAAATAAPAAAHVAAAPAGTGEQHAGQAMLDVMVSHEDLPTNNWNEMVACIGDYMDAASQFSNLQVSSAMVGCSFYQRCFPSAYLHLGFSFNSMHWQSRRACPLTTSIFVHDPAVPEDERALWRANAKADLTTCLTLRAQELVPGGMLILCYTADKNGTFNSPLIQPTYSAIRSMVDDGLLTQQELGNMAVPMFAMSPDEQDEVYKGVADLWEVVGDKEYIVISSPESARYTTGEITAEQLGQAQANFWRAVTEDVLKGGLQLTRSESEAEHLVDEFFARSAASVAANPREGTFHAVLVVLRRR